MSGEIPLEGLFHKIFSKSSLFHEWLGISEKRLGFSVVITEVLRLRAITQSVCVFH